MSKRAWALICMYAALLSGIVYACIAWANVTTSAPFVSILGGIQPNLSVPVFAQFVATQSLQMQGEHNLSSISIPLYLPANAQQIKIMLYDNGKLLAWWKVPVTTLNYPVIAYEKLPLISPLHLTGNVEIRFDGSAIAYADKAQAPAFFIETQDSAYPYGNYRIAENQKQADISMKLIENISNGQKIMLGASKDPFGFFTRASSLAPFFILLLFLPLAILRMNTKVQV